MKLSRNFILTIALTITFISPISAFADEIVAKVNKTELKNTDLENELSRQLGDQKASVPQEQIEMFRTQVLDRMIERELLYQAAVEKKYIPSNEEFSKVYQSLTERMGSEESLSSSLKENGMTLSEFKEGLKKDVAIRDYLDKEVLPQIKVEETQLKEIYEQNKQAFVQPEQVRARHILIKVEENADEATKKAAKDKIEALHTKLTKDKADFAALATENSDCPSSARGGDLDFFGKNQMVEPFSNAAFALEVGQISAPVETSFGYHIIKVEDKKTEGSLSFEEVKPELEKQITMQQQQEKLTAHLAELKAKAKVEVITK